MMRVTRRYLEVSIVDIFKHQRWSSCLQETHTETWYNGVITVTTLPT